MPHHNTAFHQLLQPVSRHTFETLAKKHHKGQKLRSVSRWDQFLGMSLSQFTGRQGLRDIESNLIAQQDKLYHLGAKPIARSSLARLNENQPAELYQALFYEVLGQCQNKPSGHHKHRFKNELFSLDASSIELSIKLFPWAAHQEHVANVKLSVGLNHSNHLPEFVALSDGNENDRVQGRQFDFKKGSIVVFDKGYNDYGWFKSLTKQGVRFVTRLLTNAVYEVKEARPIVEGKGVLSDEIIRFTSEQADKKELPNFRLVTFYDDETDKTYQFLSNHFKLCAATIAAIYKDRWQVELFFKAIKQNLKIKAFVGRSKNAVLTQLWIAMITYLLLAYARFAAKTGWTVQRILRVIQMNLFERKPLWQLLNVERAPPRKPSPQVGFGF